MADKKKALIIGAGEAGRELSELLMKRKEYRLMGFVDDYKKKKIKTLPILGEIRRLPNVIKDYKIQQVFIAIPSVKKNFNYQIFLICKKLNIPCQIIPSIPDIIAGKVHTSYIRDINMNDLLGRPPVKHDLETAGQKLHNKTCLVTGAAGSIGSELSRQLALVKPAKIICLDFWENGIFELKNSLSRFKNAQYVLADIKDRCKLESVIEKYRPDFIFHAAAYKHVHLMEENPEEAFKNNVIGTRNILDIAVKYRVPNVVIVSTDKAINPTNVMGATKRTSEKLMEIYSHQKTKMTAVRFGNVIGSNGSVIPLFEKQISAGGPVTITDSRATRYFMTIEEAAQLIIQAAILGENNEIFLLDMGKPEKIKEIALKLLMLKGLDDDQIKIKYIGLRPGEKMHEEIILDKKKARKTKHQKIWISKKEEQFDERVFTQNIAKMEKHIGKLPKKKIIKYLKELVPNYSPYQITFPKFVARHQASHQGLQKE